MPVIDLHSHSTISDGTMTPAELVRHAAAKYVDVLALTDHDEVSGLDEARTEAQLAGISLINGTEISVTWRKRTLHIVGLRIDPAHPALLEGLAALRESRIGRAQAIAAELDKAGIHGSLEGAYEFSSGRIISRTHFARFLISKGYAKDMKTVFKKYLVKGRPGHVSHDWADLADAVRWIRESGGVAVLAHPARYDLGKTLIAELLAEFREAGGAALEVISSSHSPEESRIFAHYARQFGLLASCGSDYHGPGQSYFEMGRLPAFPAGCKPVWHDWDIE